MSNKKQNITLALLSIMLVATWIWFFVSKNDPVIQSTVTPATTTEAK